MAVYQIERQRIAIAFRITAYRHARHWTPLAVTLTLYRVTTPYYLLASNQNCPSILRGLIRSFHDNIILGGPTESRQVQKFRTYISVCCFSRGCVTNWFRSATSNNNIVPYISLVSRAESKCDVQGNRDDENQYNHKLFFPRSHCPRALPSKFSLLILHFSDNWVSPKYTSQIEALYSSFRCIQHTNTLIPLLGYFV